MLSYLLLLSAWTAQGINNSLRSTVLEEHTLESASESLTPEDDSSQPILTQTETETEWFWDWVARYFYWFDIAKADENDFIKVHDGYSNQAWGKQVTAKHFYYACGMRGNVVSQKPYMYLSGLEILYCKSNPGVYNLTYTERFGSEKGIWQEFQKCPYGKFIYGFFWVEVDKYPLVDLGFWCTDDTKMQVLYCSSCYENSYKDQKPLKQWYNRDKERICGFQAQVSTQTSDPKIEASGFEGFAVEICNDGQIKDRYWDKLYQSLKK